MRTDNDPEMDPRKLRDRILILEQKLDRLTKEDVVIDGARVIKVRSPNGHYWALTTTDAGALVLVDKGTTL